MSEQIVEAPPSIAERERRPALLTRRFLTLMVAQASFGFAFSSFFLLPKYLAAELGAGPAAVGRLGAVHSAAAVVFLLVMGVAADRFGRRRFLTAGGLLMAASSLGYLLVDGIGPLIYALRILQGLAFSMAFVAGAALTVDQAPSARLSQAIGFFGMTMLAMNAIAPAVVESIARTSGWGPAFATAAAGALSCALLSRIVHEHAHARDPDARTAALLQVARRPEQMRAAIVIALVGSCLGALFVFGQLYAIEIGYETVHVLFAAYAIGAVSARILLGSLGDRIGRIRVSAAMLVLYAAGAFAMPLLDVIGLAPLGALFGVAHGLFYPTYNASVVDGAPPGERGKIVALFQGWFNAGMAVGSLALGMLAERRGHPAVFVASGAGIVIALAVLLDGAARRRRAGAALSGR